MICFCWCKQCHATIGYSSHIAAKQTPEILERALACDGWTFIDEQLHCPKCLDVRVATSTKYNVMAIAYGMTARDIRRRVIVEVRA